ncbi:MAG TPA: translation initiation factor IF-2 [Ktedonobacteraceae bacterium]
MRDTSEFPDATEQAKVNTTDKPRTPARSRSDNSIPGSQDQDARSAPRRRTPPAAPQNNGAATSRYPEQASSHTTSQSTSSHNPTTPPAAPRPPQQGSNQGNVQRNGNAPGNQHFHAPRPAGGPPAQRSNQGGPQRSGGYNSQGGPQRSNYNNNNSQGGPQRSGYTNNPPAYRSGGPAGTQNPNYSRPAGPPTNRSGAPTAPGQRSERTFNPNQQRSNQGGNTFTPQGGSGPQRSGNRSGGPGGAYRPGGPGGANRPSGSRSGSHSQRPAERKTQVVKEKPTGPISIPPQIVVKDLSDLFQVTPNEVIRGLIKHSIFASINQVVDYEKAALVAQDLGYEPTQSALSTTPAVQGERQLSANEVIQAARDDEQTVTVPPVVTIMGHVDHGKTSLLDTIRKTKVAAGEAGGITQHIGAYQVEVNGKKITFLDTPGHEAFTAMRARGAQVAHIAIIVVAADDGVMPQTREAIDHAQAAKMPIIIALNKIDKAGSNPDRVKQQLYEIGVAIEEYGGEVVCVPVSARKGTGIDELLDYILLVAEVQDIKANPNRLATGVIIEARLDKSSGPTATVLVQHGTLKMGDNIVVGSSAGKVRAMFNDRAKRIQKAPPGTPVSLLGLSEVPQAGDRLEVVADERTAKQMAQQEAEKRRVETMPLGQVSLDTLYMQMQEGTVKEFNLVLKCDVQGSAEAIKGALTKLGEQNIKVRLIHEGIGNISETDVHLAAASKAIIIGFNVKADPTAQRESQREGVDIRFYNVIYKLTDDIQAALVGMLEPTFHEVVEGHAEVIQTFKAGKTVVIAGCRVTDGKITRSSQVRVMRGTEKVFEGKLASIRRGKDDVREVQSGYECGLVLEDFTTFEIGDTIEAFSQERVKRSA